MPDHMWMVKRQQGFVLVSGCGDYVDGGVILWDWRAELVLCGLSLSLLQHMMVAFVPPGLYLIIYVPPTKLSATEGQSPCLTNAMVSTFFLWLLFLGDSESPTNLCGHFCCACKKSESQALVNSELPLSLSEPINTYCHTVIAPPEAVSTWCAPRVLRTLLRKSLVRPAAKRRPVPSRRMGSWGSGTHLPSCLAPAIPLLQWQRLWIFIKHLGIRTMTRHFPALA